MSRTLLLIICDFLLLSLLGFVRFDMPDEEPSQIEEKAEAAEEEDLTDTLREMLELEQNERERLNEAYSLTQEQLSEREQELARKQDNLNQLTQNLNQTQEQLDAEARRAAELAAERERLKQETRTLELENAQSLSQAQELAKRVQQTQQQLEMTNQEREALARAEATARERARLVQEQLAAREQALAAAEQQMQQLSAERQKLEREKLDLASELKLSEAEKAAMATNLQSTQALLKRTEVEKAEVRQQAEKLVEGVTTLAQAQESIKTELTEKIEGMRELTVNEVYSRYQKNSRVFRLTTVTNGRSERKDRAGVFVTDGQQAYAVIMTAEGPLQPGNRSVPEAAALQMINRDGKVYSFRQASFLQLDGRIAVSKVELEDLEALGVEPFPIAIEPLRFPTSVLIGEELNRFGEIELQLDSRSRHHLRVDKQPFSKILGEFVPKQGDLVFTKTGAFLGILVNRRTTTLIDNFQAIQTVPLGSNYNASQMQQVLLELQSRLENLPADYR